jgi:organic radical activating enzyme
MSIIEKITENDREFASFGGRCPFKCLHCYTFSNNFEETTKDSIDEIVDRLNIKKDFKIIYISGYKENFVIPDDGLDLMEKLFSQYKCHILFTTRNILNDKQIDRLSNLNKEMQKVGKKLFACISISAFNSYQKLEPNKIIPTPIQRIEFLKAIFKEGITAFLTLRPVCPNSFIPTSEYIEILDKSYKYCNAVITSGILVDNHILKNLNNFPWKYDDKEEEQMHCFNKMKVNIVDVSDELSIIKAFCKDKNVPVFDKSIPAINYQLKNKQENLKYSTIKIHDYMESYRPYLEMIDER